MRRRNVTARPSGRAATNPKFGWEVFDPDRNRVLSRHATEKAAKRAAGTARIWGSPQALVRPRA